MAAVLERWRPDPQQGVFETMLAVEGRAVELEAHLTRLDASLAELFPGHAAPDLGPIDAPAQSGVVRIDVVPGRDSLEARISFREPGDRFGSVALRSLPIAGGLGAHKWADRSLLDEAQAGLPADSLPLIVDTDGAVLEASRANLFAVRDGSLFTPSLDGRILPGITRMRVLELAGEMEIEAHEAELSRDGLLTADEVFLTGSVRGIERIRYVDGVALSGGDDVTDLLATELWQAWAGTKTALR